MGWRQQGPAELAGFAVRFEKEKSAPWSAGALTETGISGLSLNYQAADSHEA